ncbi:hypothetical protein FE257_002670 [Aspergillus nanangensis]|uniref:Uncharacterized protein n=1 Tax=Aspergillus nanangensis TaxID=2582783 RepID=A0AAD4CCT6_ASPNN|nr:hypothetical protein FE257_002670 [Aspergillus nanangensis]
MDHRCAPAHTREILRWRKSFASRQPNVYPNEDQRLQVGPKESTVDVFLDSGSLHLGPPHRYRALRTFLEKAKVSKSSVKEDPTSDQISIVDDRCDPAPSVAIAGNEYASFSRAWNHPAYFNNPPPGLHVNVSGFNAESLYRHLKRPRKDTADRRIIYAMDLNPTTALAIIMNVASLHVTEPRGFVLEFHIPYFALRTDKESRRDERGLRKCRYIQAPGGSRRHQECIYEAQISLMVFGMGEFFWTAYCFVDTYYSRQESTGSYLRKKSDAPSGGYLKQESPIWDPRYYFLTVLSIRLSQVSLEWTALVQTLEENLDPHSDVDDLSTGVEWTKQRTQTIGAVRQLRNCLGKLLATWNAFDSEQSTYFGLDEEGALFDQFRGLFSYLREKAAELKCLYMTLEQRVETLEKTNLHILSYWQVMMMSKNFSI